MIGERTTPYSDDEKRVCDAIRELTGGIVGCGDDPIGFMIASWREVIRQRSELALELESLFLDGKHSP